MDGQPSSEISETSRTELPASPTPIKPSLLLRPIYLMLTLIAGMLIGVGGLFAYQEYTRSPEITSYEACIQAKGSTIQESYPATCVTKDGFRFVQPIDPGNDTQPIYTDPLSCNTDTDCTVGIQSDTCCACPQAINKQEIGKNGWTEYSTNKKRSDTKTCETFAACKSCEKPSLPMCQHNVCVFSGSDTPITPTPDAYTCPKNEWVDCMPSPNAGITWECTQEFLAWAQKNCPNFKGAAL